MWTAVIHHRSLSTPNSTTPTNDTSSENLTPSSVPQARLKKPRPPNSNRVPSLLAATRRPPVARGGVFATPGRSTKTLSSPERTPETIHASRPTVTPSHPHLNRQITSHPATDPNPSASARPKPSPKPKAMWSAVIHHRSFEHAKHNQAHHRHFTRKLNILLPPSNVVK